MPRHVKETKAALIINIAKETTPIYPNLILHLHIKYSTPIRRTPHRLLLPSINIHQRPLNIILNQRDRFRPQKQPHRQRPFILTNHSVEENLCTDIRITPCRLRVRVRDILNQLTE